MCASAAVRIPGKKSSNRRGNRTVRPDREEMGGGGGRGGVDPPVAADASASVSRASLPMTLP